MEHELDRRFGHRTILVKKDLNRKVKVSIYQSNPHLWSRAVGSDPKNKMVDTSGRNECPPYGGCARIRATAPLRGSDWWFWHLIRISPGRLPLEVLWRPLGRPRILWGDYTSHLAWECLGITWKTSGIPECHRDLTPDKWKTMDGVQYWPEDRSCSGLCW